MMFNLFSLTVTITRRKYNGAEIERARRHEASNMHREAIRAKQAEYMNRMM
ncbi:YrzI family small protein [Evansella sp. LMS18]|uniref:YrzI family small protein n=1 Tax=Evansella sp. LMS18 TaxID=2924033 RepID=UPI0020D020F0|nr:YrzI family small protein [Evansella sp. LMS18]UTR11214.1 YrzI family small protein [Evansella sp. LMS18]